MVKPHHAPTGPPSPVKPAHVFKVLHPNGAMLFAVILIDGACASIEQIKTANKPFFVK